MIRLIYTPRSLEDFDRILAQISIDNPAAAVQLGEDLLRTCELLETYPQLGEDQPGLAADLQRFVCRGYGIYYRLEPENNVILIIRFLPPRVNVIPELFR